jgi:hypothetical protein
VRIKTRTATSPSETPRLDDANADQASRTP